MQAQNKELSVQFKAQHALVIGWFTLILYAINWDEKECTADSQLAYSTPSASTSSVPVSSFPASS